MGSSAFRNCEALTAVDLSSLKSVPDEAFYNCTSLATVTLPEGLTEIGDGAFEKCQVLSTINLPSSLKELGSEVFEGCKALADITLPENLTTIGRYAFEDCAIKTLVLPDSLTDIDDGAFCYLQSLTSVSIGPNLSHINNYMFYADDALTDVTCRGSVPATCDSWVFTSTAQENATLTVPAGAKAAYQAADTWKDFSNIKEETSTGINNISKSASAVESMYTLDGRKADLSTKGVVILRKSYGTTRKVIK